MSQTSPEIETLKPCPFCAAEVKMLHMDIWCPGCGVVARWPVCSVTTHETRLWNTRPDGVAQTPAVTNEVVNLGRVFAVTNTTEKQDVEFFLAQWFDCENADDRVRLIRSFRNQIINAAAGEALSLSSTVHQNIVASDPSPENIEPSPEPLD